MSSDFELACDAESLAIIGNPADVERSFLHSGLHKVRPQEPNPHRVRSLSNTAGPAPR